MSEPALPILPGDPIWGLLRDKQLELILVDAERTALKAELDLLVAAARELVERLMAGGGARE